MTQSRFETMSDGWTVVDIELFRYLVDHQPPRPSRFWRQLRVDARGCLPRLMWASSLGLIALGISIRWWTFVWTGGLILVAYGRIFRRCLGDWRTQEIYQGFIDTLKPHPLFSNCAVADAYLKNGDVIPVAFDRELVAEIMANGRPAEVIFDYGPRSEYGGVIGVRPATRMPLREVDSNAPDQTRVE